MKDCFDMIFNNFATDMMLKEYNCFVETDLHYNKVKEFLESNSDRYNQILNMLEERDRDFIKEYISNMCKSYSTCLYKWI
ncbi:hypothetical protein PV797_19850 [Clostridiaceae bacterium M8S5]|nr:hypothetical protein PV797_19850 [Clostridiaceae bacterium M8S5]